MSALVPSCPNYCHLLISARVPQGMNVVFSDLLLCFLVF